MLKERGERRKAVDPRSSPVESMRRALVPSRVLEEVQLMVVLRVPPLARSDDLRDNFLSLRREVLLLDL
jgi:hypothetical protein